MIEKLKYVTLCFLLIGFILVQAVADFIVPASTYFKIGFVCLVIYSIAKLFADSVIIEKFKYGILILVSLNWFDKHYDILPDGYDVWLLLLCILSIIAFTIAKIIRK